MLSSPEFSEMWRADETSVGPQVVEMYEMWFAISSGEVPVKRLLYMTILELVYCFSEVSAI